MSYIPVIPVKSSRTCPAGWRVLQTEAGQGVHAKTYQTCCEENCTYIAKILDIEKNPTWNREYYMQNKAAKLGVAPAIIDFWIEDKYVIFVMPALKETFETLFRALKNEYLRGRISPREYQTRLRQYLNVMKAKLQILRDNGICHNDLHLGNVMIGQDENVYIIDYGLAKEVDVETAISCYETDIDLLNIDIEEDYKVRVEF